MLASARYLVATVVWLAVSLSSASALADDDTKSTKKSTATSDAVVARGADVGKSVDAMAAACPKVAAMGARIAALSDKRKASQLSLSNRNREVKKRLRALALARKNIAAASKKPGVDLKPMFAAADAQLQSVETETKTAKAEIENLGALEDQLVKLVDEATAAQAACTSHEASIRAAALVAKKLVAAGRSGAAKARALARLPPPTALEKQRAKHANEVVALKVSIDKVRADHEAMTAEHSANARAAGGASPVRPTAEQIAKLPACDARKWDWSNFRYPPSIVGGPFELKAGKHEGKYGRGRRSVTLEEVDYAPEHGGFVSTAFVRVSYTFFAPDTPPQAEVFVLQAEHSAEVGCRIKLLGVVRDDTITGGTPAGTWHEAEVEKSKYLYTNRKGERVEWAWDKHRFVRKVVKGKNVPLDRCDLSHVDWHNRRYGEYIVLKNGKHIDGDDDGADYHWVEYSLHSVTYADEDSDRRPEALVAMTHHSSGDGDFPWIGTYHLSPGSDCRVVSPRSDTETDQHNDHAYEDGQPIRSADLRRNKLPKHSMVGAEEALSTHGGWYLGVLSLEWGGQITRYPKLQPALDGLNTGFEVWAFNATANVRVLRLSTRRVIIVSWLRGALGNWPIVAYEPATLKLAYINVYGGDRYDVHGSSDPEVRAALFDLARAEFLKN